MLLMNGRPQMLTPLSLRLVQAHPVRQVSFVSDIDGYVRVMQEVDTTDDPLAKVRITRRIDPTLGWKQWLIRALQP